MSLSKKTSLSKKSKNSKKSKKTIKMSKKTKSLIESKIKSIIESKSEFSNKNKTYLIGDYGNLDFIFVSFTPEKVFIHKNISYPTNKKTHKKEPPIDFDNLEKALQFGEWKSKEYEYISVYMSGSNSYMDGYEKKYEEFSKFPKELNSCHYMLVRLHDNNYLSLGYSNGRFTFKTPDNDIILRSNWGEDDSDSGNLNAYLVGEKYTYSINDYNGGSDFDFHFYISNEDNKKYNDYENPHLLEVRATEYIRTKYLNSYKVIPKGIYLKTYVDKAKKFLKIFTLLEEKRIFDIIHLIDDTDIGL